MQLGRLLRQTVSWRQCTGRNDRGDRQWSDATTVPANVVTKLKDLIGRTGEVTTATTQVIMLTEPSIGDELNGREVVNVRALVDGRGNTAGYAALTR